ncbi:hypothetical protein R9C00_20545 [Flammeovirgaceae bacterium SG7u.111]|nr:hypothetical protein [Flammeovirgaceae bacterium SG7u.132]WPO34092.1 hypothetical protein R9C00_20545 [Flammeovirgaceae bacterium SG7u.111]
MQSTGALLKTVLTESRAKLLAIPEKESEKKPAPDKWSAKEIIGHLVDSASNNHQRFVRTSFQDHMVFEGYAQDGWVELQAYQSTKWEDLIEL